MAERWRVLTQRATERFQPNGQFAGVVEVTVETAKGTTKTFTVPEALYNVTYVQDMVNEWVDREHTIAELTG